MIDVRTAELNKLKLEDLIADAVERKDVAALEWLQIEANSMKQRTREDGTKYEVRKSIVEIRPAYLKKFLNYQSKSEATKQKAKAQKKAKAQQELDNKFAAAFAAIGK